MKTKKSGASWYIVLTLLICMVVEAGFLGYYYMQYTQVINDLKGISIRVNLLIDYGNGTRAWSNSTLLPLGATVINATEKVARVEYDIYGTDAFVTSINGVKQNMTKNMFWTWWYWDKNDRRWILGPTAYNKFILSDDATVALYYENCATWPPLPPSV